MKKYWQQFCEWFDGRNERERILIMVVCVVAVISVWLTLVSDPQRMQHEQLLAQETAVKRQQEAIQIQINAIIERTQKNPNKVNELKIAQLQKSIAIVNDNLQKKMHGFVDPRRMATVLENVLKQKNNLHLLRLESLPAEFILADISKSSAKKQKTGLYRHGFVLVLQGSYLHTLDYLKALEELPWDFYWDGIDIEIIKYPWAKITLKLHTLSLKEGWIGV